MSEYTRPGGNDYPKQRAVEIDGQQRLIYDTGNLFAYVAAALRKRERDQTGEPPSTLYDGIVEYGPYKAYFDSVIDGTDERRRRITEQATVWNGFLKRVYAPDRTDEEIADYEEWREGALQSAEFQADMSDVFEEMIPMLEANGIRPSDITV